MHVAEIYIEIGSQVRKSITMNPVARVKALKPGPKVENYYVF